MDTPEQSAVKFERPRAVAAAGTQCDHARKLYEARTDPAFEGGFDLKRPTHWSHCPTHGMEITGHCLAWHQQYPRWFFNDGAAPRRANWFFAVEPAYKHDHASLSRPHRWLGCVNEAIADQGEGMLRQTPWVQSIGDNFVEQAFRIADPCDPQAELYYNDFNIELPAKRTKR